MAVAFDAVGPGAAGTQSGTSPLTWSHVNGGSATLILVGVSVDAGADGAVTASATYGGSAMTSLQRWESGGNTKNAGFVQVFYKFSPLTGSNSVSVSATTGFDGITGGSISFTGATSLGTPVTSDSNAATATTGTNVVPTTSASNMAAVFFCNGSNTSAFTAGTSRFVNGTGAGFGGAASFSGGATAAGTGGNVTFTWTQAADWYAAIGVEIQASGGAVVIGSIPQQQVPPIYQQRIRW
jgi:hypothetical protein